MTDYSMVNQPVSIGNRRLRGRTAVAPMTRTSANADGRVTQQMVDYYREFADGGFALVMTEGTYIDERESQAYLNQPGIATTIQAQSWLPVVESVHAAGGAIVLQLMHAGALVQHNRFTANALAPSSVRPKGSQLAIHYGRGPYGLPVPLDAAGIACITDSFAAAGRRAHAAGFDGVEIHGANGYLLDQFLNPETNRRTDAYGGSARNRVRLTVEVTRAVRAAVGQECLVGVRISQKKANDPTHRWSGDGAEADTFFRALADSGASYLHVTELDATAPFAEGRTLSQVARMHGGLPVVANGGLGDPERAARLLADGAADMVALGTAAIATPDWPNRVRAGEPIAPFEDAAIEPLATLENTAAWRAAKPTLPDRVNRA